MINKIYVKPFYTKSFTTIGYMLKFHPLCSGYPNGTKFYIVKFKMNVTNI